MGGIGSGRHWYWSTKDSTADYRRLDIRRWARDGLLVSGNRFGWEWKRDGRRVADISVSIEASGARLIYRAREAGGEWESMDYTVPISTQACNFGGNRSWFRCPVRGCGKRVAILYGGKVYACRHCRQLAYPSQNEERYQRAARRADKIRARLGWQDELCWGVKPKGMHWSKFNKLTEELDYWDGVWNSALATRYTGILSR